MRYLYKLICFSKSQTINTRSHNEVQKLMWNISRYTQSMVCTVRRNRMALGMPQ